MADREIKPAEIKKLITKKITYLAFEHIEFASFLFNANNRIQTIKEKNTTSPKNDRMFQTKRAFL